MPGQLARQAGRSARPARRRRGPHRPGHRRPVARSGSASTAEEIERLDGKIEHFFHLAAIYDLTADADSQRVANVEGTRHALQLAEAVHAEHFHQVSSIAAAGLYQGVFTEDMFDEATDVDNNPYYATKHESERVVREESHGAVAGLPAGHRRRLVRDRRDRQDRRPVLLLPRDPAAAQPHCRRGCAASASRAARSTSCPVDYVAKAMDYLAHQPGLDGRAFHLTDPEPMTVGQMANVFAKAAKAPQFAYNVDTKPIESALAAVPKPIRAVAARLPGAKQVGDLRARRTRHPARGAALPQLPDALRLDQDAGSAGRVGHRGAAAGDLRADAVGVLGAHLQPGPPQGPRAGPCDQGQDRDDHRCVVGHRPRDRAAGRRGRRQGHPRRARRREARADPDARSRTSAASRSCTAATCPT